jgi:hypothetical protein
VAELGGDPDFAQEAFGAKCGRQIGREDLDGNPPSMLPIQRQVDCAHPSPAELTLDRVATPERRGEAGQGI